MYLVFCDIIERMQYGDVESGKFISRPNRFLARVELEHGPADCHVKNTSRLWELLLPGVRVSVQRAQNPARKTKFDLIAVRHGDGWVNIDSAAPNKIFGEWLLQSGYLGEISLLKPEAVYGHSRLDFYIETPEKKIYAEVKGVTLVEEGIARFPGAPTTRGVKHMEELCRCLTEGFEAMAVFIIQRGDVRGFSSNDAMQAAFGQALREAENKGVEVLALDCDVTPDSIKARNFIPVFL